MINTAARLKAAARANGVLVGEGTYRQRGIDYEAVEAVEATGKAEPVAAWFAIARRARLGLDGSSRTVRRVALDRSF